MSRIFASSSSIGRSNGNAMLILSGHGSAAAQEPYVGGEFGLELATVDDVVEHALLQEELGPLEALGQVLLDRLLDDPRPCEADERLGLGDYQVAQRREAGRHTAGGRVGEDADVGQPLLRQALQGGGGVRHLQ